MLAFENYKNVNKTIGHIKGHTISYCFTQDEDEEPNRYRENSFLHLEIADFVQTRVAAQIQEPV